jgi:serine/threonine protein kinase
VSRPLRPGAQLAPGFEVIDHLKRTQMLDTYDAWSEERHARCIAKTLRPDRMDRVGVRRALAREWRILDSLTHPHIVRAYEHLISPPTLILETLQGSTLARMLEDAPRGRLGPDDLGWLGLHLCSALAYLHDRSIVHLDLKPSNVISECGQAKLIDFSIARAPGRSRPGIGTPEYMAPEQGAGGHVESFTDVYGLGGVLYEAATGEQPRPGALLPAGRRLPAAVTAAITAALAPIPRERPALGELEAALASLV